MTFFQRLFVPLDERRWNDAAGVLGVREGVHSTPYPEIGSRRQGRSVTQELLIPWSVIAHWKPFFKEKKPGVYSSYPRVTIKAETFDALATFEKPAELVYDYFSTLRFLNGELNPVRYKHSVFLRRSAVTKTDKNALLSEFISASSNPSFLRRLSGIQKGILTDMSVSHVSYAAAIENDGYGERFWEHSLSQEFVKRALPQIEAGIANSFNVKSSAFTKRLAGSLADILSNPRYFYAVSKVSEVAGRFG